jgi:hypothetical protein
MQVRRSIAALSDAESAIGIAWERALAVQCGRQTYLPFERETGCQTGIRVSGSDVGHFDERRMDHQQCQDARIRD